MDKSRQTQVPHYSTQSCMSSRRSEADEALQRLERSIAAGRPREESLSLLNDVRSKLHEGGSTLGSPGHVSTSRSSEGPAALPVSAFRHARDASRYESHDAALRDPLLSLEEALRRHYTGDASSITSPPSSMDTIGTFLTDIIMEPPKPKSLPPPAVKAPESSQVVSYEASPDRPEETEDEEEAEEVPIDRRDLETPFPFHRLTGASSSQHATFLERLYSLLRFGKGMTYAYLLDTMGGDTQSAVLTESAEPGVRCVPFVEHMVKELTTCITVRDTARPLESQWEADAKRAKEEERARRYPLLESSGGKLPSIDPRLDFAVDRPVGILEALEALLPDSVTCRSSCNRAAKRQFIPPSRGRACTSFSTRGWVEVSLGPWACCIASYAIASACPITGGAPPRNWLVEVAHGNGPWTVLREHVRDESISNQKNYAIWDVPAPLQTAVSSKVRIRSTGPNARHEDDLQVSHIELYGRYLCCWPNGMHGTDGGSSQFGAVSAADVPRTRFVPCQAISLPPEPAGAKKPANKKK